MANSHNQSLAMLPPSHPAPPQLWPTPKNIRQSPKMMHNVYSRSSPRGGTGLFAASQIIAGQLITGIPEPLVTVPDDAHLKECCSWCMAWKPATVDEGSKSMLNPYRDETSLNYCAGCRVVRYCGKDCQKADWRTSHKVECAIFKELQPRILPGSVRAVLRMLFTAPGDAWGQIRRLESHEDGFKGRPERWEMVTLMAMGARAYSRTILPIEEVRGLYCRLLINSITLVTPTFDPIGIAFDPLASLINHSCNPNSVMVFDGRELSVRALRELAKDEEVTISYVDHTNPTHKRREELQEQYFFNCECEKCIASEESTEPTEAFTCAAEGCGGPVCGGECQKCTKPQPFTSSALRKLEDDGWAAIPSPSSESLLNLIKSLHATRMWPLQHQPLPSLHHELIHTVYIPASAWPQALLHSLLLYLLVDPVFYPQRHHPVRVTHAFTLASLFLQVSGDTSSLWEVSPKARDMELDYGKIIWGLLCEVVAYVGLSHGPRSAFAETVKRKKEEVGNDLGASEVTKVWVRKKVNEIGLDEELAKVRVLVEGLLEELRKQVLNE